MSSWAKDGCRPGGRKSAVELVPSNQVRGISGLKLHYQNQRPILYRRLRNLKVLAQTYICLEETPYNLV
jgi:hypothetical protein